MMGAEDNSVNINFADGFAGVDGAVDGGVESSVRKYHHGDLAAELVTTGMRLLEAQNSGGLGLREVARAVGVSPTAVYRHFPDKGALLAAIAARGFEMMGQMQAEAAKGAVGPAAFAAVGGAYVRFALAHGAVFRLMFASAPPQDLFAMPVEELAAPMRILRAHVSGLVGAAAPEAVRKMVSVRAWALVHGLAVLALDGMIAVDDALIDAVIGGAAKG